MSIARWLHVAGRYVECKVRKGWGLMRIVVATSLLIGLLIFLFGTGGDKINSTQATSKLDPSIAALRSFNDRYERLNSIKVSKFRWNKGGFDSVMIASFTLENTNAFPIKDIEITCEDFANSGTLIDRNVRIIYEIIKPKSLKAIRNFNMGFIQSQASKSSCSVSGFQEAS